MVFVHISSGVGARLPAGRSAGLRVAAWRSGLAMHAISASTSNARAVRGACMVNTVARVMLRACAAGPCSLSSVGRGDGVLGQLRSSRWACPSAMWVPAGASSRAAP